MSGRENPAPLKFCIDCGQRVEDYCYSQSELDVSQLRGSADPSDDIVTFKCSCTATPIAAPNMINTGITCPQCNQFMNMWVNYCGACAHPLRNR